CTRDNPFLRGWYGGVDYW
nr:immunoglobulin heavy chain junction region [Macaca mulatta]MPN83398.1 immunoglobulin heavy chain junction region [Macaca mulatta]MPN83423.1 immunoglobulin heavy chain junction region [Macaca mulatta]MPN83445.1 immunoglobulin heavy chain junction region [Macaca mulatta]MPN83450.1 immunoglobulin heavy chain junction region [Macaca mulatta]